MRGKVVTIFGGSGFIGKHLVRRLAAAGATIRIPTRNPQAALALKPMGDVGQIVPERWSGEAADLAALVDGADFAVNLIGILFESRRGDFDRLQGDLPGRIGAVATAAGLRRMVHVSAIGADPDSASDYARTKAAGEAGIRGAYPDATILRPSIVFGPDDGFFNRFARMAQVSPFLPLIGGGKTRFQPVFVGDVAEAVVASLDRDDAPGRLYELGGPRIYTFRELLEYVLKVTHRRRLLLDLPFGLASFQASVLQYLPTPLLTPGQVELLKKDNVVTEGARTLADLDIQPAPLEVIVPQYLEAYSRQAWRFPSA